MRLLPQASGGPRGARGGFVRVPKEGMGRPYGLDERGKRHKVVASGTRVGSRAGDILLAERETNVYRPATRTVAPLAGVPDRAVQLAVDERGTAWNLVEPLTEQPHRVVRQRDGRTLGSKAVPKPYGAGDVAARGGTAVLGRRAVDLRRRRTHLEAPEVVRGNGGPAADAGPPRRSTRAGPRQVSG
ncbi:hypothetical protein [Streptomyces neyagawaensis]|uniref:Uncharacterized protein n=1 Tax=Streptomyces neyagawaensis TaxID=42238 RepID=A0ABV3B1F7_9ACTN